jgi:hypothetical protein
MAGGPPRTAVGALAGLLGGCGSDSDLTTIPIIGGTAELREVVREELIAFEAATGGGRTGVVKVELVDVRGGVLGNWNPTTRTVHLDDSLAADTIVPVLRHELCHAINRHDGPFDEGALYERVAEGLFTSELVRVDAACRSETCRREEAFASFCGLGSFVARSAASACGERSDAVRVGEDLVASVWTEGTAPGTVGVEPDGPTFPLGFAPTSVYLAGTTWPHAFLVTWGRESGGTETALVDVLSGEQLSAVILTKPGVEPTPAPELPKGLEDHSVTVETRFGYADGPVAAIAAVSMLHLGVQRRAYFFDGRGWALVGDGCPPRLEPFAVDGHVVQPYVTDDQLSWGRIGG